MPQSKLTISLSILNVNVNLCHFSAISEQEKTTLKQAFILNFNEPVSQIATQIAVLISKVARYDCPREWQELFPRLLQAVETQDNLVQHRALLTLHHVVKAISSKRLAGI